MKWDQGALPRVKARLLDTLGPSGLKDDDASRASYGHDESDTGDYPPHLVAFASSADHVSAVFRICQGEGVPVTPCGARSGKSGGSLPVFGGVSLSLERMNRILAISADDLTAVVEPGVVLQDLMRAVEGQGLFYPPDPNSQEWCTLGGNVAENAGGPRALKYGVTRDYVIGLEWILPSGERLEVGRRTIKGVAGYDLVGLFVGSEGTLGVATKITVQLIPLPKHVKTALLCFASVHQAARAVSAVLAGGVLPRTLELLDEVSVRAVDGRGFRFPAGTGSALLVEVDGNLEEGLLHELSAVEAICRSHGLVETMVAGSEEQRAALWAARRVLSTALRALRPKKVSEDIAVPRSKIPEFIEQMKAMGEELGLLVATYGHAGDGNLHANVLFDSEADRPRVVLALDRMMRLAVSLGGTITGEHGVGSAKRDYLPLEQSPALIGFQRQLKALIDPSGLLNPGKIFPQSNE